MPFSLTAAVPPADFILKVREGAKGEQYTVELPYGPVYIFDNMEDCIDFVNKILKGYIK